MKGREVLIEPLSAGGHAAALMIDGRLEDLLVDPDSASSTPQPEAIYLAAAGRPMKGSGGVIVDLGGGTTGFLRGPRPPAPGTRLLVQVAGWAESGKAPPVSARLRLKGHLALLTPGAAGRNIARSITDATTRTALGEVAAAAMAAAPPELGLILRSAAAEAEPAEITAEIAELLEIYTTLLSRVDGSPGCLMPAPAAAAVARRDWVHRGDPVREAPNALADAGVWEEVAALRQPHVPLGLRHMTIEPTRALVAVDVNTGGDTTPAAALKANLAAARELPRQLRLRGLGGQITIDFAPLAKTERPRIESALAAALRGDGIDTSLAGWTPLGHLELSRKRARRPLV